MRSDKKPAPGGKSSAGSVTPPLSALALKTALWETLHMVKEGTIQAGQGDAVASQAREILRTVKAQLQIARQSNRTVPMEIVEFSEKS